MMRGEHLTMRGLVLASRFKRGRDASADVAGWRSLLRRSLTNLFFRD